MKEKVNDFKKLRVWQKGIDLVKDIYSLTKSFPKEESYGLTSQMRRSAISIPSNIAERFKRYHAKEDIQFLNIALGSSAELETQLIISKELGYSNEKNLEDIFEKINHISRMVKVAIKKLSIPL